MRMDMGLGGAVGVEAGWVIWTKQNVKRRESYSTLVWFTNKIEMDG